MRTRRAVQIATNWEWSWGKCQIIKPIIALNIMLPSGVAYDNNKRGNWHSPQRVRCVTHPFCSENNIPF